MTPPRCGQVRGQCGRSSTPHVCAGRTALEGRTLPALRPHSAALCGAPGQKASAGRGDPPSGGSNPPEPPRPALGPRGAPALAPLRQVLAFAQSLVIQGTNSKEP